MNTTLKPITKKYYRIIFYLWFFLALVFSQLAIKSYLSYEDQIASVKNQSLNTNTLLTAQVENLFEKMRFTLEFLKSIVEKEQIWERRKLESYLRKFLESHKEIQTLKIIDANGNYYADTLPVLSTANLVDREYFKLQKQGVPGDFIISGPLLSKSTGEYVVVFSSRINNKDGSFKGLAVITVEVKYFKNFLSEANIGSEGSITLLYKNEILTARVPWVPDIIGKNFPFIYKKDMIFTTSDNRQGYIKATSTVDAIERFYTYNTIANYPYQLFVGLSIDEFLKDWKRSSITDLTFFVLILIISHFITIIYCLSLEKIETQKLNIFRSSKMTTLGEMSGQLAHEINNPLTIIRSSAYSLKKILNHEPIDKLRALDYLDKIENTTTRITKIIAGLRAFSRSGDNDPFESCSLKKIIQDVSELSSHRLKMSGVDFKISEFQDFVFECRPSQIEQVLLNLLNNSIDAVAVLHDKWIQLTIETEPNQFRILFTDSGKGIPPEIVERIMEPFFTTKPVGKGTGLGLSISKGLIEGHQGKLTYNIYNPNTQFIIELPLKQEHDFSLQS